MPDIAYKGKDGKWGIIEVKTGNADLSNPALVRRQILFCWALDKEGSRICLIYCDFLEINKTPHNLISAVR